MVPSCPPADHDPRDMAGLEESDTLLSHLSLSSLQFDQLGACATFGTRYGTPQR